MKAFTAILALLPYASAAPNTPYGHAPAYHAAPAYGHHAAPAYGHHAAPAYGHHAAPAYGHHGYGYEEPKHNCTVQDVTEIAEVCVPAFEKVCADVELPIKKIVDKEFCYDVTRTVCTETIVEVPNEVCTYSYQKKEEATTAKTVEVTFEKKENVQMVTVCQPAGYGGYGHGHHGHGYGHNYCNEVAQTTQYNVPVVTPVDVDVTVAYPEPVKTCVDKPIALPVVSCEDLTENKCITVPEVEDAVESVEKCVTALAAPACQKVELTLPKQVCVELVYGYAHDPEPHHPEPAYPAAEAAEAAE